MNGPIEHGSSPSTLPLTGTNRFASRRAWPRLLRLAKKSLDRAQIRGHRPDLRVRQTVSDGLHDGGVVRIVLVLAALLVPVRQLIVDVVVKLSRQTRECVAALSVIAVTGRAGWNVGFRNALKIDLLAFCQIFDAPSSGFGSRWLNCSARAFSICGVSTWATLNITGLLRRRSMNAFS